MSLRILIRDDGGVCQPFTLDKVRQLLPELTQANLSGSVLSELDEVHKFIASAKRLLRVMTKLVVKHHPRRPKDYEPILHSRYHGSDDVSECLRSMSPPTFLRIACHTTFLEMDEMTKEDLGALRTGCEQDLLQFNNHEVTEQYHVLDAIGVRPSDLVIARKNVGFAREWDEWMELHRTVDSPAGDTAASVPSKDQSSEEKTSQDVRVTDAPYYTHTKAIDLLTDILSPGSDDFMGYWTKLAHGIQNSVAWKREQTAGYTTVVKICLNNLPTSLDLRDVPIMFTVDHKVAVSLREHLCMYREKSMETRLGEGHAT